MISQHLRLAEQGSVDGQIVMAGDVPEQERHAGTALDRLRPPVDRHEIEHLCRDPIADQSEFTINPPTNVHPVIVGMAGGSQTLPGRPIRRIRSPLPTSVRTSSFDSELRR